MMRFLVLLILTILAAYLLGPIVPYWGLMSVIAVLAILVGGSGTSAFFAGALAMAAVWFFVPFLIVREAGSVLAGGMAQTFGFSSALFLMGATSLLGFLLGGFSALTGNRFRKVFEKEKPIY